MVASVAVITEGRVINASQQFILLPQSVTIGCEQITQLIDISSLPFQREEIGALRGPTLQDIDDITLSVGVASICMQLHGCIVTKSSPQLVLIQ